MHFRTRTLTLTLVVVMLQFVPVARAQSFDGAFRGMLVCEKMPAAADMLTVPLDMTIRDNNVQFARPLFNLTGTRVVGSELGSGTIDAQGKLHLTSNWHRFGVTFESDYSGALTKIGGTFSGTQSWRDEKNNSGKRNCTAAFLLAPQVQQTGPQQSESNKE
ncbi:MAG: hypothetical protein WAZ97_13105 [Pseudolabrys sp.]